MVVNSQESVASKTQCGIVAVVGLPNAGKSTLVNALVGQKISIVSHKVQTTRNRVTGIALHGQSQVILMDTPGVLLAPQRRLEKAMAEAALKAPRDGDLVLLLIDVSSGPPQRQVELLERLRDVKAPLWVVLNKIDRVKRDQLLSWAAFLQQYAFVARVFMLSSLQKDGTEDLLDALAQVMPEGPWLFPDDQIATAPQRLLAAEITREVLFRFLHQELPYRLYVETESWEAFRDGSVKISQLIHVVKEGQKAIVLGRQGQQAKKIGMLARQEISEALGLAVHLFLHVKVTPDWMDKPEFYTLMGLRFAEGG